MLGADANSASTAVRTVQNTTTLRVRIRCLQFWSRMLPVCHRYCQSPSWGGTQWAGTQAANRRIRSSEMPCPLTRQLRSILGGAARNRQRQHRPFFRHPIAGSRCRVPAAQGRNSGNRRPIGNGLPRCAPPIRPIKVGIRDVTKFLVTTLTAFPGDINEDVHRNA